MDGIQGCQTTSKCNDEHSLKWPLLKGEENESSEGEGICFILVTSVKILFPDLNAYDRLHRRTMNNLAQFSVRICVVTEYMKKRERKIIRKSLNNDDEIELSFRFNEN